MEKVIPDKLSEVPWSKNRGVLDLETIHWRNICLTQQSECSARPFVDEKTLKSICHAIFESHLHYSSLVWAHNLNS